MRDRKIYLKNNGVSSLEDLTVLKVYVPNNKALKFVTQKRMELQGEEDKYTIIVSELINKYEDYQQGYKRF